MHITLKQTIQGCSTLEEILAKVREVIKKFKRENGNLPVAYVAGKVTADGQDKILSNLQRLSSYTDKLNQIYSFVFLSADIFDKDTYWKLNLAKPLHEEDFYKFWREILKSGVTDVYFTPDWNKSTGATDEYSTAKKLGLKIHYFRK